MIEVIRDGGVLGVAVLLVSLLAFQWVWKRTRPDRMVTRWLQRG